MRNYEVVDENRDVQTGELQSFLIIWDDGEPELKNATPENYLLFIEELYDFINGNNAVILNEAEPEIIVSPTGAEYSYFVTVNGHTVETTPKQSESVLRGIMNVIEDDNYSKIRAVHSEIIRTQVRYGIINALKKTFSQSERNRITIADNGWLIDDFYLIDWKANLYTKDDDPEEGDYERSGSEAVKTDKSYEMVMLSQRGDVPEQQEVTIGGNIYTLTEREMLFLAKVTWTLHRTYYHKDVPFWLHIDSKNNAYPEDYDRNT